MVLDYCRHQLASFSNMAGKIFTPAKCEFRSVICFLQAEGWFVDRVQCSCVLSGFTMIWKSHFDFWSCPHSSHRPPAHCCCHPGACVAV
ncbi:hypothetical protein AVEN_186389-1 [Araneus ventricosus]|uniref:Uncharacterized protein n=1 Tax=Araneus ventricosus TaxID=182803 RepID=A0A4Y2CYV4_ARAVE|nr:hypothetical protein AVEN_186389-1 [Araneus ventricosus]